MTQAMITAREAERVRYIDRIVIREEMARERRSEEHRRKVAYYRRKHATRPEAAWKQKLLGGVAFLVLAHQAWKKCLKEARL